MIRIFAAGFFIAVVFFGNVAKADRNADRDARRSFKTGVRAFEDARLAEALGAFKKAYALRPSYRILYNIAQAQAEIGHPHLAIEAFEGYLADGGTRITPERKLAVEKEIVRLRGLVGEVIVKGPRGAEVWFDGERKGYLPLAGPVILTSGRHRLIVRRGKKEPCEQEIIIKGGQRTEETCILLGDKAVYTEPVAFGETSLEFETTLENEGSNRKKTKREPGYFLDKVAPWVATGLAVVTLSVAIGCASRTSDLNESLDGSCQGGTCPPGLRDDVEALPKWAGAADGLFITTAVLSAAVVALFVAPWKKKDRKTSDESAAWLSPGISKTAGAW